MILRSPIAPVPDPLSGPRSIGTVTDFVKFDPAAADYALAGDARPVQRLMFFSIAGVGGASYKVGASSNANFETNSSAESNIPALSIAATSDGGWRSLIVAIPHWADVSDDAPVVVPVQAAASATGDVAYRLHWDRCRNGATGVAEGSASSVVPGPTGVLDVAFATVGTIPGGTFETGDIVCLAVQRFAATDANDTYSQSLLMALFGWIEFKRAKL